MVQRHGRLDDGVQEVALSARGREPDLFEGFVAFKVLAGIEQLDPTQVLRREGIHRLSVVSRQWSVVSCQWQKQLTTDYGPLTTDDQYRGTEGSTFAAHSSMPPIIFLTLVKP